MSERIKQLMVKRGITIEELSRETMIDIQTLNKIIEMPDESDVTAIKLIALVLNVSIDELLEGKGGEDSAK
ncbi:helix-turn-helix domain-containing protein [Bacillus inaquosorum]|uniref:helix-turn-helix domain-containing protein n=1 Tax=Bacillus inaquosorum TaxID=483913 RepID=UPI00227F70B8|nr:helix-turn-helix transcriptional regulator [Bacillus inaquosorum]MCY9259149.1 helix-turn-helix transcriptional regulator [Bacillus spizizenii]MCY7943911.1 helix-turn-helix transcriptional regulator [Bacillus inaquosorum]MCY8798214.1 helix-turn-helix transcriptional regulator [Bacillus inaquosorum]MCY8997867.1 helix-turn-helix transcriptional regulator [Bacillus inaquosorum]MCY9273527.1 helix-turn-helix transcriptional regulator [Bacillus inaquosorum]